MILVWSLSTEVAGLHASPGDRPPPSPGPRPGRHPTARLLPAAAYDPDAFRGLIDTISCLALPEQVLARPAVNTAVHREHRTPLAVPGPDRDQLLHLLTDTLAAAG